MTADRDLMNCCISISPEIRALEKQYQPHRCVEACVKEINTPAHRYRVTSRHRKEVFELNMSYKLKINGCLFYLLMNHGLILDIFAYREIRKRNTYVGDGVLAWEWVSLYVVAVLNSQCS
ncbi:hypothetical protein TNCT_358311 [Trichonephila clavata]|uniref:Uncharacterized protein n=1 Tax=Trichonephila clavata TaxID=2740835 RepID=A0A8X6LEV7_TRICU|nr:hypothetical protein TNCT_358311 [Trichonephila clavata]